MPAGRARVHGPVHGRGTAGLERRRGDEAVLVGEQGARRIAIDELAEAAGTINYEMACAFGMRLERVYR